MAVDAKLIFIRPADGSGRLVFDDAAEFAPQATEIGIDGTIVGDLDGSVKLLWSANVSRGESVKFRQHWQSGEPAGSRAAAGWQAAGSVSARAGVAWQHGSRVVGATAARWQEAERHTARAGICWQSGQPERHSAAVRWDDAVRMRGAVGERWQSGQPQRAAVLARYDDAIRMRSVAGVRWQDGDPMRVLLRHQSGAGMPVRIGLATRWQDARRPPAGLSVVAPPVDPGSELCYDPATVARLRFVDPWAADGRLVFVCRAADPPAAAVVIPVRSYYVVHNSVTLTRLPSGAEFMATAFSLDVDADSWTFGWSASLHASAGPHMVRDASGDRVEVQCIVNGVTLRLVVDSVSRDRRFPTERISVRGRGRAAELSDAVQTFRNSAQRTAQQLMADVLTVNGASIGWTVDWGIADWIVPAGAWVHQGTYISALQDIAGAAGAYLQPHLTDKVIRVLPRYPQAPWDWGTLLTPDLELPVDVTTTEGIEEIDRPDYNRVFLGGVGLGVFGPVTRAGTAGDKIAPQVLHPLITAAEAHRQAGLAVLADTGRQERVSLQTLLLPEAGIVMPGKVVRYTSDDGARKGLVRRTNISMQRWPQLHQNLEVQTYVE